MTRALALLAVLVAAAAPQTAAATSTLHDYVLGRYAYADNRLGDAARFFDGALASDPGDAALQLRTFELALAAGDQKLASSLAKRLAAAGRGDSSVALVRLTDAVNRRDWAVVDAIRPGLSAAGYAQVVAPVVDAWTRFGRGEADAALGKLVAAAYPGIAGSYIAEQRAHMLAAAGRWSEAAAAYAALAASGNAGINWLRVGQADALQQAGKIDEAKAVLASAPGDLPLAAARRRFEAGQRIGALAPEPGAGLAWLMVRLAADLSREKPVPLALDFARVATFLAPGQSATWLVTGDVLARSDRGDAALAAYAHIGDSDPLAKLVRTRRAAALAGLGDAAAAQRLLAAAAAAPAATADDAVRLGDWYRQAARPAEAAAAYDRALLLALAAKTPDDQLWPLYFLRGSSFEQAGDWAKAEPDLRAALLRSSQEPMVLNYLGYSMIDRGLHLDEATAMLETAAHLRPDDAAIADSLGWAYFRRGAFDKAVPMLERAAAAEPGDSTINEHLGDAYWRVGRRIEAGFRWRAALDLDPAAKQKSALTAKLDYGLDAAVAQAGQ